MELTGKKVFILVETIYNDLEFWYPYYRLKEAGAEVIVVGPMGGMVYNGKAGLPVYTVSLRLNDLERAGRAEFHEFEGTTAKFVLMAA